MEVLTDHVPELLGRIFAAIEDDKRCRSIPLVCRAWRKIHDEYPPPTKALTYHNGVSEAQLRWFLKVAPSLEELHVEALLPEHGHMADFGPQLLAMASITAPKLRTCTVVTFTYLEVDSAIISSVLLLKGLKRLQVSSLAVRSEQSSELLQSFSSLRCLQELSLDLLTREADASQTEHLWKALATLPQLTEMRLTTDIEDAGETSVASLLQSLSLLTQLRSLEVVGPQKEHEDGVLPADLTSLSQLSKLEMWYIPSRSVRRMLSIPSLEEVFIMSRRVDLQPLGIFWESTRLTRLAVRGYEQQTFPDYNAATLGVDLMLSPAMFASSLRRLRSLNLGGLYLDAFPQWLAESLQGLTELDLTFNLFKRVPNTLPLLKALECLNLGKNVRLSLHPNDLEVFCAIPKLASLRLWGYSASPAPWLERYAGFLAALEKRLPKLKCEL